MLLIAEILKPQGIKGELKLKSFLDNFADFSNIKEVVIDGRTVCVEKLRWDGSFAYAKLTGIDDRNAAELLRGASVFANQANRPKLAKDRYYIADIEGCKVVCDNEELGIVTQVLQNGSADVYCVEGKKPFMFALVQGVITQFDIANKTLVADAAELAKVAVYED